MSLSVTPSDTTVDFFIDSIGGLTLAEFATYYFAAYIAIGTVQVILGVKIDTGDTIRKRLLGSIVLLHMFLLLFNQLDSLVGVDPVTLFGEDIERYPEEVVTQDTYLAIVVFIIGIPFLRLVLQGSRMNPLSMLVFLPYVQIVVRRINQLRSKRLSHHEFFISPAVQISMEHIYSECLKDEEIKSEYYNYIGSIYGAAVVWIFVYNKGLNPGFFSIIYLMYFGLRLVELIDLAISRRPLDVDKYETEIQNFIDSLDTKNSS